MERPKQNLAPACHQSSHSNSCLRSSIHTSRAAFPVASATLSSTRTSSSEPSGKFQQPAYKWFGYHSQTSSCEVGKACVIQVAAYDLESGESYMALVNPGHHHSKYVWGRNAFKEHGICKSVLKAKGIPLTAAFAGLVDFISTSTPTGHTPALVAHRGFNHHFPFMQLDLHSALRTELRRQSQTNHSSTAVPCKGHSSDSIQQVLQARYSPGFAAALRHITQQQLDTSSWPTDWLFHDSYLLARCLLRMQPLDSPLRPYINDLSGMGLARSLLSYSYHVDDVQPLERPSIHAANAARITPILLKLLQSPPQPPAVHGKKQAGPTKLQRRVDAPNSWQQAAVLYECHRPWLSRPWDLEYSLERNSHLTSALRNRERARRSLSYAPYRSAVLCPRQMAQAADDAHSCACGHSTSHLGLLHFYRDRDYDTIVTADPQLSLVVNW